MKWPIEMQLDYTSITNSTTSSIQLQRRQIKEVNGISKAKRIKAMYYLATLGLKVGDSHFVINTTNKRELKKGQR